MAGRIQSRAWIYTCRVYLKRNPQPKPGLGLLYWFTNWSTSQFLPTSVVTDPTWDIQVEIFLITMMNGIWLTHSWFKGFTRSACFSVTQRGIYFSFTICELVNPEKACRLYGATPRYFNFSSYTHFLHPRTVVEMSHRSHGCWNWWYWSCDFMSWEAADQSSSSIGDRCITCWRAQSICPTEYTGEASGWSAGQPIKT